MSDATTNNNKPEITDDKETKVDLNGETKVDLMGYEGQIEQGQISEDSTESKATAPSTAPEDVQTLINKAVKEVKVDDNGKYIYPDGIDPVLKAAIAATKSYRDNQSGFTKSQQSLKETEAEVLALREKLAKFTSRSLELSTTDQQALDNLKTSDPDKWRTELNRLESEAKETIKKELDDSTEEAREKASGEFELDRRYKYLDKFNKGRDLIITPELLDRDIPPRITNKLADASITFEEYLDEVSEYLDIGKVVTKPTVDTTTDLNKGNGSTTASKDDKDKQGEIDYVNQTF